MVALAIVAVGIALIAPVTFFGFALARPPLAAAADEYQASAACSRPERDGLPSPARPIPDSLRKGQPCAITGAIVAEKDTLSGGATRYALGLRSDSGTDSVVTLEGDNAADLWNSIRSGDRVLIQTLRGHVTLVGDGTRTVATDSNPAAVARSNALGLWIAGCLCVFELLAVGIFLALRRRGASPT